jgi:molecular chaperone GrpE (heat shock protein)
MSLPFRRWLAHLLRSSAPPDPLAAAPNTTNGNPGGLVKERSRRLAAESELQRLRLDLDLANQQLGQAQAELKRQGREEAGTLQDHLTAQVEELLAPLATPLTQLLTQHHLIEQEGKALATKDLLATSRRLWQGLAPAGIAALESIGAMVPFDPDHHQPLSQGAPIAPGETVRVRIPGLLLKGRVLKAAAVEPLSSQEVAPRAHASPAGSE